MPAVRSFFALSVLAACLAQASAGGDGASGFDIADGGGSGYGSSSDYSGNSGHSGSSGYGGGQQGGSYGGGGGGGGSNYNNNQYGNSWQGSPTQVAAQSCPPPTTATTTVTAVSPCMGNTVTAYVTQWMNAPPGCWCGSGSPPPMAFAAMGNAAEFTSMNPSFTPGLSSIPASEAVQTGVTVAGAAAAPAPTAAVSPGGFFGESSSGAMTTSGTETPGPSSSVSSNVAQPTKSLDGFPLAASSSTTTTSSTTTSSPSSSPVSAAPTTTSSPAASSSPSKAPSPSSSSKTVSSSSPSSSTTRATPLAASAPGGNADGGFSIGSFNTIDPATLTLKNAQTLGIGRRAPAPTLTS